MGAAIQPQDDLVFELPQRLEDWVPADHPARFIRDVVRSLDLAALGFKIRDYNIGEDPYSTELLLRIWLYGFFEHFRTVRRLEWACLNVMPMIWLTGMKAPDHNTLWRFWRDHRPALRKLFKRSVQIAADAGLVGMVLHAIDGTKVRARCSNDTALHKKRLEEALKKLDAALDEWMSAMKSSEDAPVESGVRLPPALEDARARREIIAQACERLRQADTEHLHPQEPEARMMRGNHTLAMSYNAQAAVDAESGLIVAQDVVKDETDQHQMVPMLEQVEQVLGETADHNTFDAGYVDGPQIEQAQQQGHTVWVSGLDRDGRRDERNRYDKCHFVYDASRDGYHCPEGSFLPFERIVRKAKNDTEGTRIYRCQQSDCPVRAQCSRDDRGRSVGRTQQDAAFDRLRQAQQDPDIRALIGRRKVIVEPAFGIIKWNYGFRRFTVAGLEKVQTQWSLVCTSFNLRKLWLQWKAGVPLFRPAMAPSRS